VNYFVYKLIPPRPTFDLDMTDAERAIMLEHVAYWRALSDEGKVLIVGPVRDSSGAWGLAVVEAASEEEVHAIASADPVATSGLATIEIGTMAQPIVRQTV
jgi:uncharacterized protein